MNRPLILAVFLVAIFFKVAIGQTPQKTETLPTAETRELNAKVVQLYGAGKFDEALPFAKRALEVEEARLGKDHPLLINLLLNVGELYKAKEDFDTARTYLERALDLGEKIYGPEDLRITRALDALGNVRLNKHDFAKAADSFSRSLAIKEGHLKSGDIEIARTAHALADAYLATRELSKAERYYAQAIRIYDQAGKKDPEVSETLNRYFAVLSAENKKDEAAAVRTRLVNASTEPGVVEGGIVNGWAIKLVQPPYPAVAYAAHASGQVRVLVVIGEDGKVISAQAVSGHPLLQGASVNAAKLSTFTPTIKEGLAVKVRGIIIYNFVAR
jgi:TonB family protein